MEEMFHRPAMHYEFSPDGFLPRGEKQTKRRSKKERNEYEKTVFRYSAVPLHGAVPYAGNGIC